VVYPTDQSRYGYNAADLLEFRARPVDGAVEYRIALQTMKERDAAAVAIGIDTGGDGAIEEWDHGIGSLGPLDLDHVVVVGHDGDDPQTFLKTADAIDDPPTPEATFDKLRNHIEVTFERDPGTETWRHYAVTGLWDSDDETFKQIQDQPSEDQPGGAQGQDPPPVFNVGFRFEEPAGGVNIERGEFEHEVEENAGSVGTRGVTFGHWREHDQARVLAERDISELHADIDFGTLADGVSQREVPETGLFYRLYGSNVDLGEGIENGPPDVFRNEVQPYAIYVPESDDPDSDEDHPLHVHLHGYTSSHSEAIATYPDFLRRIGEDRDAIVLMPEARGPGLSYANEGELDVFEAMADVLDRYAIDLDRVTLSGYSMGGFGTFRLGALYPDLFAKGFPIVGAADVGNAALVPNGPASDATEQASGTIEDVREAGPDIPPSVDAFVPDTESGPTIVENLRNVPILMWNASNDELVPPNDYLPTAQKLRNLGYQHRLDVFLGFDHFTFGFEDDWGRARDFLEGEFLGDATVEETPAHVTYRRIPGSEPDVGDIAHDGAYWVSDMTVDDDAASGLVDARSEAFGGGPPVTVNVRDVGLDPHQHVKRGTRWVENVDGAPVRNRLDIELDGVTAVTLWVDEADVDPAEPLTLVVESSRAATITLRSAALDADGLAVEVPEGESTRTIDLRDGSVQSGG